MGLPYKKLTRSRKQPIPEVKRLITYFLHKKLKMSQNQIAVELGYLNHSTIVFNLNAKFDKAVLHLLEEKIDDPNFIPTVCNGRKNAAKGFVFYKKKRVAEEKQVKLYGRNLKDIDKEINDLTAKMQNASYDDFLDMSRRLDVLSIYRQNIVNSLKKHTRFVKDSAKKVDEIRAFI